MNIVDALKTGRRLRRTRPHFNPEYYSRDELMEWLRGCGNTGLIANLTADDWEVEDVAVTITSKQFWDAYSEAPTQGTLREVALLMAKKLGFDEPDETATPADERRLRRLARFFRDIGYESLESAAVAAASQFPEFTPRTALDALYVAELATQRELASQQRIKYHEEHPGFLDSILEP